MWDEVDFELESRFPVLYQCTECGFISEVQSEAEQHENDMDHAVLDYELDPSDLLETRQLLEELE